MKDFVIVSLSDSIRIKTAQGLAESLEQKFLDIDALIDFEIMDGQKTIEKIGVEYYDKLEKSVIKGTNDYVDSLKTISAKLFLKNENYKLFNNKTIVFLDINKKILHDEIKEFSFEYRIQKENAVISYDILRKELLKHADIKVDISNHIDENVNNVLEFLQE